MANIVWDIDGVLVDLEKYLLKHATVFFERKYGKKVINPNTIDLKEMFGCTKKQEAEFWTHNLNLISYTIFEQPRYGVFNTLKKIHENGDRNIICTARAKCDENNMIGKIMRASVEHWIKKNGLAIDEIHYVSYKNSAQEKLDIIKGLNPTVVIEDDPDNIKLISESVPVIKYETNYNRDLTGKNILTATSDDSLYLLIEKIKNNKDYVDFNFLSKTELSNLTKSELKKYYEDYRKVLVTMPFDKEKRKEQTKTYNGVYKVLKAVHSKIASEPVVINPEMLDLINEEYTDGNLFAIASHTTLDDIQQVERIIKAMSFFLVKNEFSKYPIIGKFLESIGCIYVDREDSASKRYSKKQIEKILLNKGNAIILPEGTRNRTSNPVGKFQLGAVSISQNTGKFLIPIALKRYDKDHKVYIKILDPRIIDINADVVEETQRLEQEITVELASIEEYVNNLSKEKQR